MTNTSDYIRLSFMIYFLHVHVIFPNNSFWNDIEISSSLQSFLFLKKNRLQKKTNTVITDSYNQIKAKHFNAIGILNISGGIQYGMENDYSLFKELPYRLAKSRNIIFIDEVNFIFEFDNFDLTVGKKKFNENQEQTFSLTTRNFSKDYTDPILSKALGSWQVGFDLYFQNQQLTMVLVPIFPQSIRPSSTSRWSLSTTETQIPLTFNRDKDRFNLDLYQFYLHYVASFDHLDLFFRVFRGVASFPFLKQTELKQINESYPLKTELTTGVSGYFDRFHYYSEFLYTHYSNDDILEYLFGIDATFDSFSLFNYNIEIVYSGYHNLTTKEITIFNKTLTNNSFFKKKLLFKTYLNNINELPLLEDSLIDLTLFAGGLIDLERKNILFRIGFIYPLLNGLTFNLQFEQAQLEDHLYFHRTEHANRILSTLEYIW